MVDISPAKLDHFSSANLISLIWRWERAWNEQPREDSVSRPGRGTGDNGRVMYEHWGLTSTASHAAAYPECMAEKSGESRKVSSGNARHG